jgi:hypothetical protein
VFVKVDATSVPLEPGFTRDVSNVRHFGTGELEITLTKPEDLERAMPLVKRSYEDSLFTLDEEQCVIYEGRMAVTAAAPQMAASGPEPTSCDVCDLVAFGGIADIGRTRGNVR